MKEVATVREYPMAEVHAMARAIAGSGLFGVKTPDQAFALMLIAQAEGRHPATVAQEYDIIQGRPALKSQAALARFQAAGGSIRWTERTDVACEAEFVHPQGGKLSIRWTMERAQAAQLTGKDNWRKFPAQMLSARVVSEGVRAVFPACLSGLYLAEEVQDFATVDEAGAPAKRPEKAKEVQPAPVVAAESGTLAPVVAAESAAPAPEYIPEDKARALHAKALAAGFTEDEIKEYIYDDMTCVPRRYAMDLHEAILQVEREKAAGVQE